MDAPSWYASAPASKQRQNDICNISILNLSELIHIYPVISKSTNSLLTWMASNLTSMNGVSSVDYNGELSAS
jgi:hypothetical protein